MRIKVPALTLGFKQFRLAVCAVLAAFMKPIVRTVYFGVTASLFAVCGSAFGQITSVDADSFAAGTALTNAFSGVTLSVITGPNRPDGPYVVISATGFNDFTQTNVATTGSLVFGNFPDAPFPAAKGWEVDGRLFRADFANPTNWVSIDLIADDNDSGIFSAYGAGGELLGTVNTGVMTNLAFTAIITRPTADIAYITAAGTYGESMFLDNLRYNNIAPIPEPEIYAMMLAGLGVLGWVGRRKKL